MPYSADMAFIQEQWRDEAYPRENSLTLGNGFYCLFDLPDQHPHLTNKVWLPALDYRAQETCDCLATLGTAADGPQPFQARGGECAAYGGDGFVALQDKQSGRLIWLLVLRDTNPFSRIELHDGTVHAHSTCGVVARIPVDRPDQLTLTWPND